MTQASGTRLTMLHNAASTANPGMIVTGQQDSNIWQVISPWLKHDANTRHGMQRRKKQASVWLLPSREHMYDTSCPNNSKSRKTIPSTVEGIGRSLGWVASQRHSEQTQ